MRRTLRLLPAALLLVAGVAAADDFWIVPNAFTVDFGAELELRGQTSSSFPTSRAAVAVERVSGARRLGASSDVAITELTVEGRSLLLRDRPAEPGQYVIAVAIHPRSLRESASGFRRYLEAEGATEALARVDREGLLRGRDSVTRRYAKYAKALVQVGDRGGRAFGRVAGHIVEFVPLQDPSLLKSGDTLELRLLFRGAPLARVPVHFDAVPQEIDRDAASNAGHATHSPTPALRSDARGVVRLRLTRDGMWSVRTIHISAAASGSGADWDAHRGTFVFAIGLPASDRRP